MENPWHEYFTRKNKSKFHPKDEAHAFAFNEVIASKKNSDEYKLQENLEPMPYLGDPNAPFLVLLANPGASDSDERKKILFTGKKLELHKKNLLHQQQNISDYTLKFNSPEDTSLESEYFKARTKELIDAGGKVEAVATKIFFVNFHGYQSTSWYDFPFIFFTQKYTFHLVKNAILRDSHIIIGRHKIGWLTAIPELGKYPNRSAFDSARSSHMTENNLKPGVFKKVLSALQ